MTFISSMMQRWWPAMAALAILLTAPAGRAQTPASLFRPMDVVAFVGGEDMVGAADYGSIEYWLVRQLPEYQLKFRSLAKEGDTAFEQARDFNYPDLEKQLAAAGATVVVVQLGQMESLRGEAGIEEFTVAAERWLERLSGGGKRRVIVVGPTPVLAGSAAASRFTAVETYAEVVRRVAQRREALYVRPGEGQRWGTEEYRKNGLHLSERGHAALGRQLAEAVAGVKRGGEFLSAEEQRLVALIREKNQLWFHYVRPQNWAFLDGDRTVQPASRDHRDPEKRWFPEEMKEWLPLIAEREREIGELARQLNSK